MPANIPNLLVSDFLSQVNWQGEPIASPELSSEPETAVVGEMTAHTSTPALTTPSGEATLSKDWQQLSVEQFFSRNNWQGWEQAPNLVSPLEQEPAWQPTLIVTVAEFFGCFPWQAQPIIAPLPEPDIAENQTHSEREMTLSDLSALF